MTPTVQNWKNTYIIKDDTLAVDAHNWIKSEIQKKTRTTKLVLCNDCQKSRPTYSFISNHWIRNNKNSFHLSYWLQFCYTNNTDIVNSGKLWPIFTQHLTMMYPDHTDAAAICYYVHSCSRHWDQGSHSNLRMNIQDFLGPNIPNTQHLLLHHFRPWQVDLWI